MPSLCQVGTKPEIIREAMNLVLSRHEAKEHQGSQKTLCQVGTNPEIITAAKNPVPSRHEVKLVTEAENLVPSRHEVGDHHGSREPCARSARRRESEKLCAKSARSPGEIREA